MQKQTRLTLHTSPQSPSQALDCRAPSLELQGSPPRPLPVVLGLRTPASFLLTGCQDSRRLSLQPITHMFAPQHTWERAASAI